MAQSVTLHLPEETLQRYQRGATAARKLLEVFLVERLLETVPPLADDLPSPLREELQALEHLDDDDGRGQRAGNGKVQRIELAAAERQPDSDKEEDAEQAAADQLPAGGEQDHRAGADDLLEVDFQPNHEQHEDQAEFGDDADRFLGLDPSHPEWTNEKPGDKVGEDQRLAGKMGQQAEHPREQDA